SAPPSMITFCPPRPVRTKERSLDERWYSREKMKPRVNSATTPITASNNASVKLSMRIPPKMSTFLPQSVHVLTSKQIRFWISYPLESGPPQALDQQHRFAAAEARLRAVGLDHHVDGLAVLACHARLRRVAVPRGTGYHSRDAPHQRIDRYGARLLPRHDPAENAASDAHYRKRGDERQRRGHERRHVGPEEPVHDDVQPEPEDGEGGKEHHDQREQRH